MTSNPPLDMSLADLPPGMAARVTAVAPGPAKAPGVGRRLAEIGFLPGEAVRIVARGMLASGPIAVRVGTGTFALRPFEADCIRVCPEQSPLR
jgi:ferrous iron transport protein A